MEIEAGVELPSEVQITVNGQSVVVAVEYQWLPPKCSDCKVFGHAIGSCGNKPTTKPPNSVPKWQQQQQQPPKWQVVGKRDATNATELVDQAASCIIFGPSFNQCSRASPVSLEKASPSEVEPQLSETIVKNLDAVAVCKPPEYATRDDSSSDSEVEELTVDTGVESLPGADLVLVKASNSEAEINDLSPDPPDSGGEWKPISYKKKNNSSMKSKGTCDNG